ncbi:MAG TPA: phosphomannomutase/phosphoglucomutase [Thermomicrobiales bacterium]|nr:phosphomannomutase/phosphoglucomutase [Thermomicrobiales bacterium]
MNDRQQLATLFKAYDIRGVAGSELSPDIAYLIGRALVDFLNADRVCVGRDMRVSSPALAAALIDGIRDQGADATDIGLISTDGLYFAVGKFGYPAGVMVTASHNPGEYNGFKLCREQARPLSMDEGIGEIRDLVIAGSFPDANRRGRLDARDVSDEFVEHALSMIDVPALRPFKVAVDAGNGMAGKIIPRVFERIPGELIPLYFELDGTFPNHEANPIEPENIKDLQATIVRENADFGIAFDGDADRMFVVDEHGTFVGGDMVTAMVSQILLRKHPGAAVVYNLICSRTVPETIAAAGGTPIRSRVGHSFIKALMREHDAIFGGEHSGHFYFRDNWYADSGLIAFLTMLELLSRERASLSEYLAPLDTRVRSGEVNSEAQDIDATIERVRERFADGQVDTLDGLTIEYPTWWFNLRGSNTQPLLRLNVEADDGDELRTRLNELLSVIRATS